MIRFVHRGNFNKTTKFLGFARKLKIDSILSQYGRIGVDALAAATPVGSGRTANSWDFTVESGSGGASIAWTNSNVNKGVNIAIILQYGHGTGTGGYVQGRNYIPPAVQPVFDEIAESVWKEISNA